MLKRETILGEPLNFKTMKDRLVFAAISEVYAAEDSSEHVGVDQVRGHLQALGAIREKRSQQYFKLIEAADENLVSKITQAYLAVTTNAKQDSTASSHSVLHETTDLVNLILADYQLQVNKNPTVKESLQQASVPNMRELIDNIIKDTSLAERLEPLSRLLLTKNDRVAKSVLKSLQRCLLQY